MWGHLESGQTLDRGQLTLIRDRESQAGPLRVTRCSRDGRENVLGEVRALGGFDRLGAEYAGQLVFGGRARPVTKGAEAQGMRGAPSFSWR